MTQIYKKFTKDISFDFLPDEDIRVFYLEAPLSIFHEHSVRATAGLSLVEVNGFHTGVGFQVGNMKFYLDYTAVGSMFSALYPTGVDASGNPIWENATMVTIGELSSEYWEHSTYLCNITKKQFLNLRDKILNEFLPHNPSYALFCVAKSTDITDIGNPILRSSTCDDFVLYVIHTLHNMKVQLDFITHPKMTIAAIISPTVKLLDYNNPDDKITILTFYNNIQKVLAADEQAMKEAIDELEKETDRTKQLALLKNDITTVRNMALKIFSDFGTIIYYDYNSNNVMSYYSITLTDPTNSVYLAYNPSTLVPDVKYIDFNKMLTMKASSYKKYDFAVPVIVSICIIILVIIALLLRKNV